MGIVHLKLSQTLLPQWFSKLENEVTEPCLLVDREKHRKWGLKKKKSKSKYSRHQDQDPQYLQDERILQAVDELLKDVGKEEAEGLRIFMAKMLPDLCPETEDFNDYCNLLLSQGRSRRSSSNRILSTSSSKSNSSSVILSLPSDISSQAMRQSMPVLQHSDDPYEDFKGSITHMILEYDLDLQDPDLEDLLYCYLSMNAPELYDVIERAYWDAWIELLAVFLVNS